MKPAVYIEIMGCQMNKLDGELIIGEFTRYGYSLASSPKTAGIVVYVTCSVRQHAEDKVISKIGQLSKPAKNNSRPILAIVGCMAERLGETLLKTYPQIDVVCSPGQIHQLLPKIEQILTQREQIALPNNPNHDADLDGLDLTRQHVQTDFPFMAYVRVMRGCNNYCRYCIVPYVRGPEQSRHPRHIFEECQRLVDQGVIEITLLGQTVNSYRYPTNGKTWDLADLLETIHEIPGLKRLRFVTSYPRNFSDRILLAMANLPKVCEYLHIPAQSGSDRILKAMNRRYTAKQYMELIQKAREKVPGITFSGDFIVGFCGEQEEDFQATQELVRNVRYKNCFIFKYSPRPGTTADSQYPDDVPEEIKKQRNTALLNLQNQISRQDNQVWIGKTMEILVESRSKKPHLNESENALLPQLPQLVGRSPGDHIVVFYGPQQMIGQIVTVKIRRASALTLFGELQP